MNRYIISIPAEINLVIESDEEPDAAAVLEEVGGHITLKNGQDFDSDEFEILFMEEI